MVDMVTYYRQGPNIVIIPGFGFFLLNKLQVELCWYKKNEKHFGIKWPGYGQVIFDKIQIMERSCP